MLGGLKRKLLFQAEGRSESYTIAEMEGLRLEVADIKKREIGNERYVSGVFAAVAISFFQNFFQPLPILVLAIFSFGFSIFANV